MASNTCASMLVSVSCGIARRHSCTANCRVLWGARPCAAAAPGGSYGHPPAARQTLASLCAETLIGTFPRVTGSRGETPARALVVQPTIGGPCSP